MLQWAALVFQSSGLEFDDRIRRLYFFRLFIIFFLKPLVLFFSCLTLFSWRTPMYLFYLINTRFLMLRDLAVSHFDFSPRAESLWPYLQTIVISRPNNRALNLAALTRVNRLTFVFRRQGKHDGQPIRWWEVYEVKWLNKECVSQLASSSQK